MSGQQAPELGRPVAPLLTELMQKGPILLIEQGGVLGGQQRQIDPSSCRPLPLDPQFLNAALQRRPFGT